MKLLITSAIHAELEPLANALQAQPTEWGWETPAHRLLPLGIGPLETLSRLLLFKEKSSALLFVGTAGFLNPSQFQIGDLVQASKVTLFDGAALMGHGHFASLQEQPSFPSTGTSLELPDVSVVNSLCVTSSEQLSAAIRQKTDGEVENLELFGVAMAAAQLKLPWSALLGLTNQVGPLGGPQWKENHHQLADSSAKYLAMKLSQ